MWQRFELHGIGDVAILARVETSGKLTVLDVEPIYPLANGGYLKTLSDVGFSTPQVM